jgi:2-amino-4-hydroxy-6-hydroxymethyldihydropteridine diphosphokinase
MRVGIALGSNLGDRYVHLKEAQDFLKGIHESGEFLASSLIETTPVDCPDDSPNFLNAVVELESSLDPLRILDLLQDYERSSGRPSQHGHHAPRTIDLDLLYCDMMTLSDDRLILPHPRITNRYFVLKPLSEICPDLTLPGWDRPCHEYLSQTDKNHF